MNHAKQPEDRQIIWELEDQLKKAERRLAEMKQERDEANELVDRVRDRLADNSAMIEQWKDAFDMRLDDNGVWTFNGGTTTERYEELLDRYRELLKEWNRAVGDFNAVYADKQPAGRPLAASDAQCSEVLKLRQRKLSLRGISDQTNLSLSTVRTIIGRANRTDRTTIKRLERIDPMRDEVIRARARKRTRDGLPKQINQALSEMDELEKAFKGSGRK